MLTVDISGVADKQRGRKTGEERKQTEGDACTDMHRVVTFRPIYVFELTHCWLSNWKVTNYAARLSMTKIQSSL